MDGIKSRSRLDPCARRSTPSANVYFPEVPSVSPFRLRRRIGPRPAFPGADATAKAGGAAPFVEPEMRSVSTMLHSGRPWRTLPTDEPFICSV